MSFARKKLLFLTPNSKAIQNRLLNLHSVFAAFWPLKISNSNPTSKNYPKLTESVFFWHALATPLTALLLNLDLCLTQYGQSDSEATKAFLTQAKLNAEYVQQLLLVTHFSKTPPGSFGVKTALQEVITRLHQPSHQQELVAYTPISPNIRLAGPVFYFQEAISCLIHNAYEAYGNQRNRTVVISCYQRQKAIVIHLSDLGTGMNWLTRHLFDRPGFTSKIKNQGVGLLFVKQVIEHYYRGKIIIHSGEGRGTTVTLVLPIKLRTDHVSKSPNRLDQRLLLS